MESHGVNARKRMAEKELEQARVKKRMRQIYADGANNFRVVAHGRRGVRRFRSRGSSSTATGTSAPVMTRLAVDGVDDAASSAVVRVAGSSGPTALSDWAALHAVLPVAEVVVAEHYLDPADFFAPQTEYIVKISNQVLLTEIMNSMNLTLHEWVVVREGSTLYRGCVEIDTPLFGTDGVRKRERILGELSLTHDGARESAAEDAVSYLVSECDVVVKDFNHAKVVELEARATCAEDFASMFVDDIQIKDNRLHSLHLGLSKMIEDAKKVVKKFEHLLCLRYPELDAAGGSSGAAKVLYNGLRPPSRPMEEIGSVLAGVVNEGMDLMKLVPK